MRLNKTTINAIKILIECARADENLIKVADLSARLDITPQNTFKIVNILSHAGFLEAVRGRYGGVKLSRPADQIGIGDVVREIEVGVGAEARNTTSLDRKFDFLIDNAFGAFLDVLDGQTLADMATEKSRRPKLKGKKSQTSKPRASETEKLPRSSKAAKTSKSLTSSDRTLRS